MNDLGRGYGCGVAAVVVVVPILPLAFVLGWSGAHCAPVPSCQRSGEWHIALIFFGVLLFAAVLGYGLRQVLNAMAAKREDEGHSVAFSGAATALSCGVILAALGLLYTLASLR